LSYYRLRCILTCTIGADTWYPGYIPSRWCSNAGEGLGHHWNGSILPRSAPFWPASPGRAAQESVLFRHKDDQPSVPAAPRTVCKRRYMLKECDWKDRCISARYFRNFILATHASHIYTNSCGQNKSSLRYTVLIINFKKIRHRSI